MEKKYYFRGLGLGIIVTAVIMGIALSGSGKKVKMTDDEVIARAKELGMIEDSRLLESSESEEDGEKEAETPKQSDTPPVQKENAVKQDAADGEKKETAKQDAAAGGQKEDAVKKDASAEPEKAKEEDEAAGEKSGDQAENKTRAGSADKKPSADTNEMTKQDEDIPKPETESKPVAGEAKSVTISSGDGSYTVARKLAEAGVVSSADAYDDFLCANGYDKKLRPGTFKIPANAGDEQIARIVTGQE